jgi:hypothetical protein
VPIANPVGVIPPFFRAPTGGDGRGGNPMSNADIVFVTILLVLFVSFGVPGVIYLWIGVVREIRKLRDEEKSNV